MDVEKNRRAELIEVLSGHFICFEEVDLRHALMTKHCIRADVVAIPNEPKFWGFAIAFEVKEPTSKYRNSADWIQSLRQAADYVYASIEPKNRADNLSSHFGRRIAAAFLYPVPSYMPNIREVTQADAELVEKDDRFLAGAMQLALHFRVGGASWEQTGIGPRFRLIFGPNEVWRSDCGFCHSGPGLLSGKRTLGSRKVDVMAELDGIGQKVSYPEFE